MNTEKLRQVLDYCDVYEFIAAGTDGMKSLDEEMRGAVNSSALQRRRKWITESPAYLSIKDDRIEYDVEDLNKDIDEFKRLVVPWQNDAIHKIKIENVRLKNEVDKLTSEKQGYIEKIEHQEEHISNLMAKIDEMKASALRAEMGRKVLVSSSIKVGPKKDSIDEAFLIEPETLLDVDKCVARYGGELDYFYEETPTDKKDDKSFEPGHELTLKNYLLRLMKTVGTKGFFKKRVRDNQEVKEIESKVGQLFPGHYDYQTERQKERDRILKNRYISLNKLMQLDRITNQEKLMMYAMVSPYHNTNIERLLNYAGQYCINADYLIALLEDPDICTTYENTIDFLNQFASPSEFKMKYDFAQELIEGKFNISKYDINILCNTASCGLNTKDESFVIVIKSIVCCMIEIWHRSRNEKSVHEIVDLYQEYKIASFFKRELNVIDNDPTAVYDILLKEKDFSMFTWDTMDFYEDIFSGFLAAYVDGYREKGKRADIEKKIRILESYVNVISNDFVKNELEKRLFLGRGRYTIWDVNKVNTEYNFHNKNFLNTQIEKYGVNHLEDVLYTIYLLNIDKLLPEILISISLCFKKNIAYKEKFVKEIKSSQLIVDMLVLSAYINYSDEIKNCVKMTEAYEEILMSLTEIRDEKAAVLLDEFRIH